MNSRACHYLGLALVPVSALFAQDEAEELPPLLVGEARIEWGTFSSPGESTHIAGASPIRFSLPDMLRGLPGIVALDSFGGFEPPRVLIRGSGIQSAPVSRGFIPRWNGLPLCWADGSFNMAWLDASLADGWILRHGPAGWLGGLGTMGGSLDARSHTPVNRTAGLIEAQTGSWSSRAFLLKADEIWQGQHLGLRIAESTTDGFRPHSAQERHSLSASWSQGDTNCTMPPPR